MAFTGTLSTYGGSDGFPVDIEGLTSRFVEHNAIGQGGFGKILSVYDRWLDSEVAFKISPNVDSIRLEVDRLRALSPQYFVRTFDFGQSDFCAWYSMELLKPNDSWFCLADFGAAMDRENAGSYERTVFATFIVKEVASGLKELHDNRLRSRSYFHGDVKPGNIFFNLDAIKDWRDEKIARQGPYVKIIDLGVSGESGSLPLGYTERFAAPEQIKSKPCDIKVDTYAISVVLLHLIFGPDFALPHVTTEARLKKLLTGAIPQTFVGGLTWMLSNSMVREPHRRTSCADFADDMALLFFDYTFAKFWRLIRLIETQGDDGEVSKKALIDHFEEELVAKRDGRRRSRVSSETASNIVAEALRDGLIASSRRNYVRLA